MRLTPSQIFTQRGLIAALAVSCGLAVILLACTSSRQASGPQAKAQGLASVARNFSDKGLQRLTADMDPAMLALARRHDPLLREADPWGPHPRLGQPRHPRDSRPGVGRLLGRDRAGTQ